MKQMTSEPVGSFVSLPCPPGWKLMPCLSLSSGSGSFHNFFWISPFPTDMHGCGNSNPPSTFLSPPLFSAW